MAAKLAGTKCRFKIKSRLAEKDTSRTAKLARDEKVVLSCLVKSSVSVTRFRKRYKATASRRANTNRTAAIASRWADRPKKTAELGSPGMATRVHKAQSDSMSKRKRLILSSLDGFIEIASLAGGKYYTY